MVDHNGSWMRPRGRAWGNSAQRAVLHAIAEDVAKRTEHKVVAIEALRSDGFSEFVAIAGDDAAREKMLGQASPLVLDHLLSLGQEMDGWRHVPNERLDDDVRAWLDAYGHKPDVPASGLDNGWDPDDQLVRLLENDDGELRALLYLDEPLSGLRPTRETVAAINAEVAVMFEAIISIVERELYGEQVRMVAQARRAIESVRPGLGVEELLVQMSQAMLEAMDVASVEMFTETTDIPALEPDRRHVREMMHRQWRRRGHLVVERQQTWGMREDAIATPLSLSRLMAARDLGSYLLVPFGAGEEHVGTLALGRTLDASRWSSSEINAATVVAADLARLVLEARLVERERALNAELRSVADYRRDMVFTLAHELRNPLSVLWTHLELLTNDAEAAPLADSLPAMDRAARRIDDMVEDMMALGTVSDPEREMATERLDLTALVRECCDFLAPVAAAAELELEVAIGDGLVVTGDAAGLQRTVNNLLSNALKYTPAGGRVALTVTTEVCEDRAGVRLRCADTGIGIGTAELGQVFTPFFRSSSREARQRRGTGLGLAVVEQVVKRHGGEVIAESELGVGSTFTVWLPSA